MLIDFSSGKFQSMVIFSANNAWVKVFNIPSKGSLHDYDDIMSYCLKRGKSFMDLWVSEVGVVDRRFYKDMANQRLISKFSFFQNGILFKYWGIQNYFNKPCN